MGKSAKANKPLTQEEIWDDSALVQSWDEAVEEYKVWASFPARDPLADQNNNSSITASMRRGRMLKMS